MWVFKTLKFLEIRNVFFFFFWRPPCSSAKDPLGPADPLLRTKDLTQWFVKAVCLSFCAGVGHKLINTLLCCQCWYFTVKNKSFSGKYTSKNSPNFYHLQRHTDHLHAVCCLCVPFFRVAHLLLRVYFLSLPPTAARFIFSLPFTLFCIY